MTNNVLVQIARIDASNNDLPFPSYVTEGSAGMDLCAAVREEVPVKAGETALIPTGFAIALPPGYEAQIRPRSGLALKHQVGILNAPGTIDADYRGEVKIILTNFGKTDFVIRRGDRIAQMIVAPFSRVSWKEETTLNDTARGSGGFGHSGTGTGKG